MKRFTTFQVIFADVNNFSSIAGKVRHVASFFLCDIIYLRHKTKQKIFTILQDSTVT